MKKILVISWFYPPINSSEGLVTFKLLNNSKLNYDVFTQNGNDSWSYGNNVNFKNGKNITVYNSKTKDLAEWVNEAVEFFENNKDKYNMIMTRSMPPESHIVGLKIKEKFPSVKWIASFGDPIYNSPYVTYANKNVISPYRLLDMNDKITMRRLFNPLRFVRNKVWKKKRNNFLNSILEKDKALEHGVLLKADKIIYNNPYQEKYMSGSLKEYNKEKSIILPHTYDLKLYDEVKKVDNKKVIISYVGHLDKIRSPRILFEGLKELDKMVPDLEEKVEFHFYGNMDVEDKYFIVNNNLMDIVKIKKPISYEESLKVMKTSTYNLLIDANLSKEDVIDENIYFAAKLADYMGAGRPIIGISMLEGASAEILREINALLLMFSANDIANYLYLILYQNYNFELNKSAIKKYDAKEVAKEFDKEVNKIL